LEAEDFVNLPAVDPITRASDVPGLASHYHLMLADLVQLRSSYEERYGGSLKFDFRDLDRAQQLHPHMRILERSPESLRAAVQSAQGRKELWDAIEARSRFGLDLAMAAVSGGPEDLSVARALEKGEALLRGLFRRLFKHLHGHAAAGTLGIPEAMPRQVERRDASELSVREFVERYAGPGRPVIITGLRITEEEPWTLDFFRERCNVTALFHRQNMSQVSWARLEAAGSAFLADFIDTFRSNATRRHWYLHDWSLPIYCPQAFGPAPYRSFTVPKYFAGDYFQRASFDGYQHTWPSLFIGSNETQSAMHIDSGGTNFWLYLLSGRKEWRFFSHVDMVNLYKQPAGQFFFDVFNPDLKRFPLVRFAEMYTGIQEAGELVFIPGGNPHGVRNLEDIHGVSMNYVDLSNIWLFLWHMLQHQAWQTFEQFTDGTSFPHGLRSEQEPLRFGAFKSVPWRDLAYDLQ